jgi:type VI secretion system protein ImpA
MGSRADLRTLDDYLRPIPGASPVGVSLSYDPIYDQVREARREDDPSLSQGIWKTELKEADWAEVERLCSDALISKSKDLHLAGWLTEAWICLDQFEGLARGVTIFANLANQFWDTIYPVDEEGIARSNLLDWYLDVLLSRMILIPITKAEIDSTKYTYADYMGAQHLQTLSRRQNNPKEFLEKAAKSSVVQPQFIKSIAQTSDGTLAKLQEDIDGALDALKVFYEKISAKTSVPSTKKITDTLGDIKRILTNEISSRKKEEPVTETPAAQAPVSTTAAEPGIATSSAPQTVPLPQSSSPVVDVSGRSQAYQQLAKIADYLEKIEPHSPTPRLLRQLVAWENKNLIDIFNQIAQTPQDLAVLMKLLGG